MKVGGPYAGDDLLEQMQAAANEATEATSASKTGSSFATAQSAELTSPEAVAEVERPAIEVRLKETASSALSGEIESPAEVRAQAIEIIVDERFGDALSKRERRDVLKTLKSSLVADPAFKREVDSLLLLAAREVGRRES